MSLNFLLILLIIDSHKSHLINAKPPVLQFLRECFQLPTKLFVIIQNLTSPLQRISIVWGKIFARKSEGIKRYEKVCLQATLIPSTWRDPFFGNCIEHKERKKSGKEIYFPRADDKRSCVNGDSDRQNLLRERVREDEGEKVFRVVFPGKWREAGVINRR